jgi:hypothetical protein
VAHPDTAPVPYNYMPGNVNANANKIATKLRPEVVKDVCAKQLSIIKIVVGIDW